jgi:hypothetical protein
MDDLVAVPEWTQVRQKSGLDPLGLQAPSIRLYQALVPRDQQRNAEDPVLWLLSLAERGVRQAKS